MHAKQQMHTLHTCIYIWICIRALCVCMWRHCNNTHRLRLMSDWTFGIGIFLYRNILAFSCFVCFLIYIDKCITNNRSSLLSCYRWMSQICRFVQNSSSHEKCKKKLAHTHNIHIGEHYSFINSTKLHLATSSSSYTRPNSADSDRIIERTTCRFSSLIWKPLNRQ